jgi:hypothetical protein
MNGKLVLYMSQYGDHFVARTVKELKEKAGPGRVSKMYQDTIEGTTVHVGYVIGRRWFTAFVPYEVTR